MKGSHVACQLLCSLFSMVARAALFSDVPYNSIVLHFIEFDLRTNFCRLRFLLTDLGAVVNLIESGNKRHRMKRASSGVRCRL